MNKSKKNAYVVTFAITLSAYSFTALSAPLAAYAVTSQAVLSPITAIDTPGINQNIYGNVDIVGWALNKSGIEKINVLVDGKYVGQTTLQLLRPDVNKIYSQYGQGDKVGFKYTLSTSNLTAGSHKITAEAVGKDGTKHREDRYVNIQNAKWNPITAIDEPGLNASTLENSIKVSGWAINSSGVKNIRLLLDGKLIANLQPTIDRPDVQKVYSSYNLPSKIGYQHTIDITNEIPGKKTITVEVEGKDGTKHSEKRILSVKEGNWKPITAIDNPGLNFTTGGDSLKITGWGINPSGVKNIKIYLDDRFVSDVKPTISRPDVQKAYSSYGLPVKLGYEYNLNLSDAASGRRKITVEVEGNNGLKHTDTRYFTIDRWSPITAIDNPGLNASTTANTINISGWGINPSGVKNIKIYVDGTLKTTMVPNVDRPDVKAVYSKYNLPVNIGYSYTLDLNTVPAGARNITVEVIGNNGTEKSEVRPLKVVKWNPVTAIDAPGLNETKEYSNLKVSGWAINHSGVKIVKILVDDKYIGEVRPTIDRPDVKAAFPSYNLPVRTGYEYTIPYSKLPVGTRKITAEVHGNDGSIHKENRTVTIKSLGAVSKIETPSVNQSFNNSNVTVKGYALQNTKVVSANIYIDNDLMGTTEVNKPRADIASKYPQYNQSNSGFEYVIPANNIKPGSHTLKVEFTGTDGTKSVQTTSFKMVKAEPVMNVESPTNNMVTVESALNVSGWALNASGVKEVQISLDGKYKGNASLNQSRPDVGNAYPSYVNSKNSGYSYKLNLEGLAFGGHNITVKVIGNDGTVQTQSRNFNVNGKISYTSYPQTLDYYIDREIREGAPVVYYSGSNNRPATREDVARYMNPDNFFSDETSRLMFMKLTYFDGITASNLNSALQNKGVLTNKGSVFLEAGRAANVNPIYLVSHALLETGNGGSKLANGVLVESVDGIPVTPRVTYNVYGIGAKDSDALRLGSEYAYKQGWFSVDAAIKGGAAWIGKGYITNSYYKQDTLYKMRYNLNDKDYWHQYSTDVAWAYKQTSRMKTLIDQMGRPALYFELPVFKR
ncbi:Ig-like domain-containing protein [Clostridium polynesiense]|uniref:Ig-like domain-containing protein n=1 Tax=Clostridium polynesiense TaxID=1325933 RepID=UPI000693CA54|nr:Ig-like domain-containing protein [Clostridium polynesiense]